MNPTNLDGLARELWLVANGDVPGDPEFWEGLPSDERACWIAEAARMVAGGVA